MRLKLALFILFVLITVPMTDASELEASYKNSVFVYDDGHYWGLRYSFTFNAENEIHILRSYLDGANWSYMEVEYEALADESIGNWVYMMITRVKVKQDDIVKNIDIVDYINDGGNVDLCYALFYDWKYDQLIKVDARNANEYFSKYVNSMSLIEYLNNTEDAEVLICKRKQR